MGRRVGDPPCLRRQLACEGRTQTTCAVTLFAWRTKLLTINAQDFEPKYRLFCAISMAIALPSSALAFGITLGVRQTHLASSDLTREGPPPSMRRLGKDRAALQSDPHTLLVSLSCSIDIPPCPIRSRQQIASNSTFQNCFILCVFGSLSELEWLLFSERNYAPDFSYDCGVILLLVEGFHVVWKQACPLSAFQRTCLVG